MAVVVASGKSVLIPIPLKEECSNVKLKDMLAPVFKDSGLSKAVRSIPLHNFHKQSYSPLKFEP